MIAQTVAPMSAERVLVAAIVAQQAAQKAAQTIQMTTARHEARHEWTASLVCLRS